MRRSGIFLLLLALTGCDIIMGIVTPGGAPSVRNVAPENGATNVSIGTQVNVDLDLPNGGLNPITLTDQSVALVDLSSGTVVPSSVSVDNDARTLTLDPANNLDFSTEYRFAITSAVEDESGAAFSEHVSTFTTISDDVPAVIASRPADGERNVPVTTGIATDLNLPNSGVDANTITSDTVYLANADTGERVAGTPGTTGGRDSITFQPSQALDGLTEYQFNITSAVTDEDGVPFLPYTSTFTTSDQPGVVGDVDLVPQPAAAQERHSSLAFGPDGNLYATTIDGRIKRYPVGTDGTLGSPETITSLQQAEGGPRLTIGLTFDPEATADNLIVWVTHTELGSFDEGGINNGVDAPWAGKLTRLSGPNLETVQDVVIGLPRSSKDHVTNSVAFNPSEPGVVYFVQGSNTAMGAPDPAWRFQEERVLSGAVLRLDTSLLGSLPLNAQTEDGGTYDPYAPNAPLTVYASGTRNSYDLVWHSNGNLYVPANGSAAGGIVPRYDPPPGACEARGGYSGPVLDSPSDVNGEYRSDQTDGWVIRETQNDYLYKIEEGGYYGTPNPKRCEWILHGGGAANDSTDVPEYPSSVQADPNYRGFAYDFGKNISPNGAIEYSGNAFGDLQGRLLVTRYSQGDDVVAVSFDSSGNASSEAASIVPPGSFVDPIEIAEDPNTGYLYVSSYDELSQDAAGAGITLLRP
jgi:glucose/arabinose dehydrogenase